MEKVWFKSYAPGQLTEIDPDVYVSVTELITTACQKYPTRIAFSNFGTQLSYQEFQHKAESFAAYLQSQLGIVKGDRVAIMLPNCLQYPIAMHAILLCGAVVVNVNPLYTATELRHQLKDSGATAIVILANFVNVLENVMADTSIESVLITQLGDMLSFPKSVLVNFVLKYIKRQIPRHGLTQAIDMQAAMTKGLSCTCKAVKLSGSDLAFLQYTGGTTGRAKGAMLSHRNIIANVEQIYSSLLPSMVNETLACITPLPMYHIFSLTANCLTYMRAGAKNVLITNPRDIPAFVKEMAKEPFQVMMAVNTLFNALLNNEQFQKLDHTELGISVAGGMAAQKSVADRWHKVTGHPLIQGYGLTETAPLVTSNPCDITEFTGSIGLPAPNTDVSVRDEAGLELGFNEPGELWVKGPQVMSGYWQQAEETAKSLTAEGWFKTGDIGTINEQGYMFIVDRKKDMIVVSGFNVYPNEVENVIAGHDAVLEVGCVGVPDDKTSEAVKAFVVLKPRKQLTVEELRNYCREFLTGYKVPRYVAFRDELPKTNVGKILRRELK